MEACTESPQSTASFLIEKAGKIAAESLLLLQDCERVRDKLNGVEVELDQEQLIQQGVKPLPQGQGFFESITGSLDVIKKRVEAAKVALGKISV